MVSHSCLYLQPYISLSPCEFEQHETPDRSLAISMLTFRIFVMMQMLSEVRRCRGKMYLKCNVRSIVVIKCGGVASLVICNVFYMHAW